MNVLILLCTGLLAGTIAARRTAARWRTTTAAGIAGAVAGSFLLGAFALRGPLVSVATALAGALALAFLTGALRRST